MIRMAQYVPSVGVDALEAVVFILRSVYAVDKSPPRLWHGPDGDACFKLHVWQDPVTHVLSVHREYIAHTFEDSQVTRLWLTDYQFAHATSACPRSSRIGRSTPPQKAPGPRNEE